MMIGPGNMGWNEHQQNTDINKKSFYNMFVSIGEISWTTQGLALSKPIYGTTDLI